MNVRKQVGKISVAMLGGLREIIGEHLHGFYIYGAAAFPDDFPTGDIDFHVILNEPLTGAERAKLERLHENLARDFPPLGAETDGYYLLLKDARQKEIPKSQMWRRAKDKSWALHRAHILAGRCLILHGPDPKEIYRPAAWEEIERALAHEFRYVKKHLGQYPDYAILQLCRLIYSFRGGDVVVSKAETAGWAAETFPQWQPLIDLAKKNYARRKTAGEREALQRGAAEFFDFAAPLIRQPLSKSAGSVVPE